MSGLYYRPLVQSGAARPDGAVTLAGGALWFTHAERLDRDTGTVIPAAEIPEDWIARLCAPRAPIAGLAIDRPQVMGILNVTPDSFSDGGRFNGLEAAQAQAARMRAAGATIIDIGGESTRPGAAWVSPEEEIARTAPVIEAIRGDGVCISIDTRKAPVAAAALEAGAGLINDVSAFTYDPDLMALAAAGDMPVCLMHSQGDPGTMQDDPRYDNVVLDVYDALAARVDAAERAGIGRARILVDPGIGFGKTLSHNLTLLHNLSLFHGLGCAILLGVSRKRFIGTIGGAEQADARMPGSVSVGLAGIAQGVQVLRVHDVAETVQALRLWQAVQDPGAGPT